MLSGLIAGALGVLGGAKRWLNKEAALAIAATVAVVALLIGGVLLFGAGGSSAVAKRDIKWLSGLAKINTARAKVIQAQQQAADTAAAAERDRAISNLKAQMERVADLERQLGTYTENPVAFPRALVRSMSR